MTSAASRTYVESYVVEGPVEASARTRAEELGVPSVGQGAGAALRFLAAAIGAKAVVEVGTGAGVSGLWLLGGMRRDGVLTTVDLDVEHQRAAKQAFVEAEVPPARTRVINGAAADVLPRLTDAVYDLVFVDTEPTQYADLLEDALRLLRDGGVVVFDNALFGDRVADPSARDSQSVALRDLGKVVREHEELTALVIPLSDGLLAAVVAK